MGGRKKTQRTPVDQRGPLWEEGRGRRRIGAAADEVPQEFVIVIARPDARRFADGRIGVCGDYRRVGRTFLGLDCVLLAAAEGAREGEVWLHRERRRAFMFFLPTMPGFFASQLACVSSGGD